MKIFVCYTTRDKWINLEFLSEIDNLLKDIGSVFIDLLHNTSLNKQERVIHELSECDLVLVLNTKCLSQSFWAQYEIKKALELGKGIIYIDCLSHESLIDKIYEFCREINK